MSEDVRTWLGVVEGIVCVLEVTVELKETGPQVNMMLMVMLMVVVQVIVKRLDRR